MNVNYVLGLFAAVACAATDAKEVQLETEIREQQQKCLLEKVKTAEDRKTAGQIRRECFSQIQVAQELEEIEIDGKRIKLGMISKRILKEQLAQQNDFAITPHDINYMLPVYATSGINQQAYKGVEEFSEGFKDIEAKFQLSVKAPLSYGDLFTSGDGLYFAFTLEAWWQVYATDLSSPFRETNYKPEVFYIMPTSWKPFDGNTGLVFGMEHQSNGRSSALSRSWNRLYANLLFEKGPWAVSFQPWFRLPEDTKEFVGDTEGDDNPDIQDYMGHFEFGTAYHKNDIEYRLKLRQNFSTGKGAAELSLTTPLWGKLRGYVSVFNGYGDSMIDYNHHQTRFGLGIALNNMF
ncbi:phospholipase A [Paraferrimonas sp. SM1919]|uniref:phospholipase A n=1 Tax=Paraferrimonas sp. SM1919 TaxID=2662263 RepID=UPI0013D0A43C|nr:phospholipase A [Paraferrimonas sp. SM1919]